MTLISNYLNCVKRILKQSVQKSLHKLFYYN